MVKMITYSFTKTHTHTLTEIHWQTTVQADTGKTPGPRWPPDMTPVKLTAFVFCFFPQTLGASVTQWAWQRGPWDYQSSGKANPGFHCEVGGGEQGAGGVGDRGREATGGNCPWGPGDVSDALRKTWTPWTERSGCLQAITCGHDSTG